MQHALPACHYSLFGVDYTQGLEECYPHKNRFSSACLFANSSLQQKTLANLQDYVGLTQVCPPLVKDTLLCSSRFAIYFWVSFVVDCQIRSSGC